MCLIYLFSLISFPIRYIFWIVPTERKWHNHYKKKFLRQFFFFLCFPANGVVNNMYIIEKSDYFSLIYVHNKHCTLQCSFFLNLNLSYGGEGEVNVPEINYWTKGWPAKHSRVLWYLVKCDLTSVLYCTRVHVTFSKIPEKHGHI